MKNKGFVLTAAVIALFTFILSCGTHKSPNTITSPLGFSTPIPCALSNYNYSALNYGTSLPVYDYIITTEADYLANYSGWASAGTPTPTPVPVDFNKQTVIGVMVTGGCQSPTRGLSNITTNCNSVIIDISTINSWCPGGVQCYAIMMPETRWYVMDKTYLPIMGQYTNIDECTGVTTTSTGVFAPPYPTGTMPVLQLPTVTPTPAP